MSTKNPNLFYAIQFNNGKYLGRGNVLVKHVYLAKFYTSPVTAVKYGEHRIDRLTKWYGNTELVSCEAVPVQIVRVTTN